MAGQPESSTAQTVVYTVHPPWVVSRRAYRGGASQALSHPCNVQLQGCLMQEDIYTDGIQSRLGIQGTCLEAALTSCCLLLYPWHTAYPMARRFSYVPTPASRGL